MDISTAAARRHAAWRILERTAKPTDGWVARTWNRPISRRISFAALSLGLKASHASTMTLLVGLATAVFAMRPGYVTLICTGILFQLTSVLDGVDGEIARATLTESETGARLDAIVDQVTYVACFIGVAMGWAREGGGTRAIFWTAAIALALVLSLVRGARFVSRHAPDASFVFIYRTIHRAARESNLFTLRIAAESFSLLRRDLFAIVFLAVSFLGRRALVPGLVAFGIILANVTLSVYRRELAAAAVAEHPGLQ
jgi:CDP-L-myo-inositol myo-inositolphosphotransferase